MRWQGAWNAESSYEVGDIVAHRERWATVRREASDDEAQLWVAQKPSRGDEPPGVTWESGEQMRLIPA